MLFEINSNDKKIVEELLRKNNIEYKNYSSIIESIAEEDVICTLEAVEDRVDQLSEEQEVELFEYVKKMALNYDYSDYNEYLLDCALAKISSFDIK